VERYLDYLCVNISCFKY